MKKLFTLLSLTTAIAANAQYIDRSHYNPLVYHVCYSAPALSGVNTESIMFPDTIPAGYMYNTQLGYFLGSYKVTTGASATTLTIKLKFGGSSATIMTARALNANLSNEGMIVEVWMDGEFSVDHQIITARITTSSGIVYAMTDFYENPNVDNIFSITMQLGGAGYTGATITPHQQRFNGY